MPDTSIAPGSISTDALIWPFTASFVAHVKQIIISTFSDIYLTAPINTTVSSSASSGTNTFNVSNGNVQNFTFSGSSASDSVTFAITGAILNQIFLISITQNSGGSGTVTWFSTIRWTGGGAPTLTLTPNKRDVLGFICTGSGTFDGFVVGQNI